ncbi:hypothetical protein [Agrobacterium fabrum]|uniref:hypothetical protein n=1 Tax=Agrobacterium fabrum TaxID=1176649 RepID=UPI003BA26023
MDTLNHRREIADRVLRWWKRRGIALDAIPEPMSLVELWIEGTIDGPEMHNCYLMRLQAQAEGRIAQKAPEASCVPGVIAHETDKETQPLAQAGAWSST